MKLKHSFKIGNSQAGNSQAGNSQAGNPSRLGLNVLPGITVRNLFLAAVTPDHRPHYRPRQSAEGQGSVDDGLNHAKPWPCPELESFRRRKRQVSTWTWFKRNSTGRVTASNSPGHVAGLDTTYLQQSPAENPRLNSDRQSAPQHSGERHRKLGCASTVRRWLRLGVLSCGIVALSSCASSSLIPFLPGPLPETEVNFQIRAGEEPGQYELQGEANFPNRTEINLMAIRLLEQSQADGVPKLTYSVLDYQVVSVEAGAWEGELMLWQQSAAGVWQETWQLDQTTLSLRVDPLDEVVFLATFTPIDQLTTLEGILAQQGLQLSNELLRTTAEGQRYLHLEKTVSLPLPPEDVLSQRPEPHNGGWSTRYLLIEEPPMPYQVKFPDERQSNRPATVDEFLY